MSQKNTASRRAEPALVIYLPVIMATVCQKCTYVMETMTVLMALMKETDMNAVSKMKLSKGQLVMS